MKKTFKIIIAAILFFSAGCLSSLCHAQSGLLERTNVGLSFNSLKSVNFSFGNGVLKGHPERSVDLTAGVRLWQHLELGAVLSLQGASATGSSGVYRPSTAPNVDFYYLQWDDNRYHLGGGVILQLHLVKFDKRFQRDNKIDLLLRGGWGHGAQVDGFWFGFSEEFRISRQLVWYMGADYGDFPFSHLKQVADGESAWRFTTGLKLSLR